MKIILPIPHSLLVVCSQKCQCTLNEAATEHCVSKAIELFRARFILLCTRCALSLDDNGHECITLPHFMLKSMTWKILQLHTTKLEIYSVLRSLHVPYLYSWFEFGDTNEKMIEHCTHISYFFPCSWKRISHYVLPEDSQKRKNHNVEISGYSCTNNKKQSLY